MDKRGARPKGPSLGDIEKVVINQALVMADTFSRRYTPISLEMPRCLMPLCNVPMLDYTIEMLASSGIQEIYIFSCNHSKLIQDHIARSHWQHLQGLKVIVLVSKQCSSLGEALREVHAKGNLTSDFVLIFGDVVSNLRIDAVLQAHRERRLKTKNAIMTMVLKKATPAHPTRSIEDDTVVAMDPTTHQLLAYENAPKSKKFKLSSDLLGKSNVQLRYDLLDCHIDVCSPEVLASFVDNPDYMDMRRDFIRGTIADDVFNYQIYTHILSGEYAARAKDLRTYAATSKDVLHRWAYPITPESNLLGGSYQLLRGPIYRERDVKLSIVECHIYPSTIIGGGSSVGSHSIIRSSVIGRNCHIGAHCRIEGAFLWDNVTLADGVTVVSSVLCSGVTVGSGSKIEGGSVLSFNVVVGPNVRLEPHTRLTTVKPNPADYDDEDPTAPINLGAGGVGRKWIAVTKEEMLTSLVYDAVRQSRDEGSDSEVDADPADADSDDEDAENNELADETDYGAQLLADVVDTVIESDAADAPQSRMSDLASELKIKRTTYNKDLTLTVFDVGKAALVGVLSAICRRLPPAKQNAFIMTKLTHWAPLLKDFAKSGKREAEEAFLQQAKEFLSGDDGKALVSSIDLVLKVLFDEEVISRDAVVAWEAEAKKTDAGQAFLVKCAKFLEYATAEDDEEEEEEDE